MLGTHKDENGKSDKKQRYGKQQQLKNAEEIFKKNTSGIRDFSVMTHRETPDVGIRCIGCLRNVCTRRTF